MCNVLQEINPGMFFLKENEMFIKNLLGVKLFMGSTVDKENMEVILDNMYVGSQYLINKHLLEGDLVDILVFIYTII